MLRELEERLLTTNDLRQFLEMILAAVRDRFQAPGAYVAAFNGEGLEMIARTGQVGLTPENEAEILACLAAEMNDQTVIYPVAAGLPGPLIK